ncbi:MAG: TetR/AcrR family transcriptional regulator [Solirubrobacterales bacterium]|nr:TetR/AcrR family transcriptional regulator [Solirubrobacterales bacterium]
MASVASPPASPVLRAKYDRRRAQLVVDAAAVFARSGYDQTSVAELTDELDLASGGLYHYFGGKEQLLIGICDELMEPLLAIARAIVATDDSAADRLRALVRAWVAHVVEHRDHMLVFQQERHVIEHGAQWKAVRDSRKAFERLVEQLLDQAIGEGAATGDRRVLLSALLGMVNHTAQWYRPGGRVKVQALADGYVELVLG